MHRQKDNELGKAYYHNVVDKTVRAEKRRKSYADNKDADNAKRRTKYAENHTFICKICKHPVSNPRANICDDCKSAMITAVRTGKSHKAVAAEFGVTPKTVASISKKEEKNND